MYPYIKQYPISYSQTLLLSVRRHLLPCIPARCLHIQPCKYSATMLCPQNYLRIYTCRHSTSMRYPPNCLRIHTSRHPTAMRYPPNCLHSHSFRSQWLNSKNKNIPHRCQRFFLKNFPQRRLCPVTKPPIIFWHLPNKSCHWGFMRCPNQQQSQNIPTLIPATILCNCPSVAQCNSVGKIRIHCPVQYCNLSTDTEQSPPDISRTFYAGCPSRIRHDSPHYGYWNLVDRAWASKGSKNSHSVYIYLYVYIVQLCPCYRLL